MKTIILTDETLTALETATKELADAVNALRAMQITGCETCRPYREGDWCIEEHAIKAERAAYSIADIARMMKREAAADFLGLDLADIDADMEAAINEMNALIA